MRICFADVCLFKPKKKSRNTQDLRLCFMKDVHTIKNEEVAGEYCELCLYVASNCSFFQSLIQHTCCREKGAKKADAFFTGNGSSHRTHITRYPPVGLKSIRSLELMHVRFHYARYLQICEAKGIEPRAHAPEEFQKKNKYVT